MHTFNGKNGTVFHYNSDFSGEVLITRPKLVPDSCYVRHLPTIKPADAVEINGDDILSFVAEYARRQRITALEQADDSEILGGSMVLMTERP